MIHLSAYCEEATTALVLEPDGRARTLCGRRTGRTLVIQPGGGGNTKLVDCPHCWAILKAGRRATQAILCHGVRDPVAISASVEWADAMAAALGAILVDGAEALAAGRAHTVKAPQRVPA